MPKGLQHKGIVRRNKMIYAAVKLFLENGYEKTTTASIAKAAGMSPSSFFAAFDNKEALLLTLVKTMFGSQFDKAEKLLGETPDPLLVYGVEVSIQMYIAELSEPLRELYVVGYSLPTTSEYIYMSTAQKIQHIFSQYIKAVSYTHLDVYKRQSQGTAIRFTGVKADQLLIAGEKTEESSLQIDSETNISKLELNGGQAVTLEGLSLIHILLLKSEPGVLQNVLHCRK